MYIPGDEVFAQMRCSGLSFFIFNVSREQAQKLAHEGPNRSGQTRWELKTDQFVKRMEDCKEFECNVKDLRMLLRILLSQRPGRSIKVVRSAFSSLWRSPCWLHDRICFRTVCSVSLARRTSIWLLEFRPVRMLQIFIAVADLRM
jgi:hypothetical protein